MSDTNDVQALETVSNAAGESRVEIILSNHYFKAQTFLVNKIRKQCEHQKEVCSRIIKTNSMLETDTCNTEQNLASMIKALEAVETANVELRKELLLAKEKKTIVLKRVSEGIRKYEDIWKNSQTKYENLPYIKKYLQIKAEKNKITQNTNILKLEAQTLMANIYVKRSTLADEDRKRIVELAEFLLIERPKLLLSIKQKKDIIDDINILKATKYKMGIFGDVGMNTSLQLNIDQAEWVNVVEKQIDEDGMNTNSTSEEVDPLLALPKLEHRYIELDVLTAKLDQIKKADSFTIPSITHEPSFERITIQDKQSEEKDKDTKKLCDDNANPQDPPKKYCDKKLINILNDIKLNKNEVKDILSNMHQSEIKYIDVKSNIANSKLCDSSEVSDDKHVHATKDENAEEDLNANDNLVVVPPTEFMDLTVSSQNIDENSDKKLNESGTVICDANKNNDGQNLINESINIENIRAVAESCYEKMKDSLSRKSNLDLSPEVVYTKKPVTFLNSEEDTSKFFEDKKLILHMTDNKNYIEGNIIQNPKAKDNENIQFYPPKSEQFNEAIHEQRDSTVAGLLFNHGPSGIPSLDLSISSTCFGDGESNGLISNGFMLSPKTRENLEIQDTNASDLEVMPSSNITSFISSHLTVLRKAGLSFLGASQSNEVTCKTDDVNETPQQSSNFNLGNDKKTTSGSFFSMFN